MAYICSFVGLIAGAWDRRHARAGYRLQTRSSSLFDTDQSTGAPRDDASGDFNVPNLTNGKTPLRALGHREDSSRKSPQTWRQYITEQLYKMIEKQQNQGDQVRKLTNQ